MLNAAERVTWQGRFRSALADAAISPRPVQAELPIWLGVGGNPGERPPRRPTRAAAGARQYQPEAGEVRGPDRRLQARRRGGRLRPGPLAGRLATHCFVARDFARSARHVLPVLRQLFPQPRAEDQLPPGGRARGIRGPCRARRRDLRRQPARDHRQDHARARTLRAPALPGPSRHRRAALRKGRRVIELLGTKVLPTVR